MFSTNPCIPTSYTETPTQGQVAPHKSASVHCCYNRPVIAHKSLGYLRLRAAHFRLRLVKAVLTLTVRVQPIMSIVDWVLDSFDITNAYVKSQYEFASVVQPTIIVSVISIALLWTVADRAKKQALAEHWAGLCRQVAAGRDAKQHKTLDENAAPHDTPRRDEEDNRIAKMMGTQLMEAMRTGKLSSQRVVAAFSRRANSIGHLKTRSITEEFYDEAMAEASAVDDSGRSNGSGGGVLLGMPVSIKDVIHMKGAMTTCGMACRAAMGPSEEDGLIVKAMRAHGAVPFVRGNVPQCLMLPESNNAIWGRAENPWNLDRTPGGSSGGDGSLVASRSAPIAIGSDVGGSIRIPAHFTGTCGLKPTPARLTQKGMGSLSKTGKRGQQIIHVAAGPLANSVADLELAMTALCSPAMWDGDAGLPRLPWNRELAQKGPGRPLKVGFFTTDHWFEPCTSVRRAVHEAAEGLRAAGHEVVPFEPVMSGWDIARLYYGQMGAEGNMKGFVEALQGEKMLKTYADLRRMASLPNFLRPLLGWVLKNVLGDRRRASILRVTRNGGLSVRQYYELVADTFDLRSKWEEAFSEAGLDAVLFPPAALPALPHGAARDLTPAFSYMMLANLLHWPAGVVPVTLVSEDEQEYEIDELPRDQRDPTAAKARKALQGSVGLPIGVQVMTTPFKEELALHVMSEVEEAVKFSAVPELAGF